ncbi:unnamed protein product, partial [Sphacelaria rigidula]
LPHERYDAPVQSTASDRNSVRDRTTKISAVARHELSRRRMKPQRQVLKSRWGLDPVVVGETRREIEEDELGMECQANSRTEGGDLEETEETGVILWDCAQVLWDLLSNPCSSLSVQGK